MTSFIRTQAELKTGLARLVAADPRLGAIIATAGAPHLRRRPAGFPGLCATVLGQQLSTASASAIWQRLAGAFDPFSPAAVARAHPHTLARIGLSKPKIKTIKAIAAAVADGELDLAAVARMSTQEARAALVALHGVGPWTAESYLLFCLGHADAWPAGDLALREAARCAFRLTQRPSAAEMARLAEPWRPWRGVAAHLLWHYYRALKQPGV